MLSEKPDCLALPVTLSAGLKLNYRSFALDNFFSGHGPIAEVGELDTHFKSGNFGVAITIPAKDIPLLGLTDQDFEV